MQKIHSTVPCQQCGICINKLGSKTEDETCSSMKWLKIRFFLRCLSKCKCQSNSSLNLYYYYMRRSSSSPFSQLYECIKGLLLCVCILLLWCCVTDPYQQTLCGPYNGSYAYMDLPNNKCLSSGLNGKSN